MEQRYRFGKTLIRTIIMASATTASVVTASAQNLFTMADGSGTGCQGVIFDSGGQGAVGYQNGENYTFTICPDVAGNVIYLTFSNFDLDQSGPQNSWDNLSIYDGDNTSATYMGTYTGDELQNLIVSGTVFNLTGCLTLVFQSNSVGTGVFAASFQCTVPCENPLAVASMNEAVPYWACQGEPIQFDGSASFAQQNYTITQYLWNFDDGTVDSTSGPLVTHAFADDGEHVVQLLVTDDNGCSNLNLVDLQVLVSTTPSFALSAVEDETCFGETLSLVGVGTPITWTGMPDAGIGEPTLLPDDVGAPYASGLTYEQFNSGQTLGNVNDLLSICVEMEHSYMGDLVLQLICPNGQTTILHQQGGGGVFIGDANDQDFFDPEPGTCWTYCWSPTATNGTFAENSTSNTIPSSQGTALEPGTYEAVQSFNNLLGCPLNGEWTFQSTDLWGADNGFICNWTINWNPAIIPDVTTFTPTIGEDSDSSFWQTADMDLISFNGDTAVFTADAPGTYNFDYTVIDNFGCTYDTTFTLIVNDPIVVDAGLDQVICNDPLQMNATAVGATTDCAWVLEMNDTGWDGWNGASLTVTIDGSSSVYTCTGNQTIVNLNVEAGQTISLSYTAGTWEWEVSYTLLDDLGNEVFSDGPNPATGAVWNGTTTCNGEGGLEWEWTPATGLSATDIPDPTVLVTAETDYTVTAWPIGHPACATSDQVTISIDPGADAGQDTLIVVCATPPIFNMIDMLAGTPQPGGVWTDAGNNVVSGTFNPQTDAAGTYTYTVTTPLGCIGMADLEIEILPASDPSCCGIVDAGPDETICTLTYGLHASVGNTGTGTWSGPAGYVFSNAFSPNSNVTAPASGPAMFYWIEDDGVLCYLIDSVTITFTQPLEATPTRTDAICYQSCDGTMTLAMEGGNGVLTYAWSNNIAGPNDNAATDLCYGVYSVTITDENGCSTSEDFSIDHPPLVEVDATSFAQPWCHGECNGSVTITDAEAVEYSFDGGATYGTAATLPDVCAGIYNVAIKNADACVGTTQVTVSEPPQVLAEFNYVPTPANVNDPTIHFYNYSENSSAWLWDIAGLLSTSDPSPTYRFDDRYPGVYPVCLVAIDTHGCVDTVCHDVIINDVLYTYVPNSFTPDGDGINDLWLMTSNIDDIASFEMQVFDRWGQLVFESTDPLRAWDGTAQGGGGEILKQDMYAYRITYQVVSTSGWRELMGHVTLLK